MAKENRAAQTLALEFEKPILQLERQINELVALQETKGADYSDEVEGLRHNLTALVKKTYQNLSAWETVQVARHPAGCFISFSGHRKLHTVGHARRDFDRNYLFLGYEP